MTKDLAGAASTHAAGRKGWLALPSEPVINPDLPIIDAHHHLWDSPERCYAGEDLLADIGPQQNVIATVFVECKTHYLTEGDPLLRPNGEMIFAHAQRDAAQMRGSRTDLCAAMVGYADLCQGSAIRPLLEAELESSRGRMRSIRNIAAWHPGVRTAVSGPNRGGMLLEPTFQIGLGELTAMGLKFETMIMHTQLDDLVQLARRFPNTEIVMNHMGGPMQTGPFAQRRDEVFTAWRAGIARVATCPNVSVKLGGFGVGWLGFELGPAEVPPNSATIANTIQPFVEACIESFGPERCMFESNFPVDSARFNYVALWNAYKRVSESLSKDEVAALFHGTAAKFYGISINTIGDSST